MSAKLIWTSPELVELDVAATASGIPAFVEQEVMTGPFTTQQQSDELAS